MISEQVIQQAVRRLVAAARPSRIILFGSYATGTATENSDLDLMVIKHAVENRGEEMVRLRGCVGDIGEAVDVLIYSEDDVEERKEWCTSPIYWALREGRVLYESA